ncbi:MAG TPA: FG-GAP-like repeat-containing protein [Bryobacteraceae bacterium]|nr:FG-GAP-like repeat-containing protein [Bryobacteraceae bacterium]
MRDPTWALLCLSFAGVAAAQTISFSAKIIVTPANIVGGYTQGVAVGDFNGDGKPDLVLASNGTPSDPQVVAVLLGNADGTFQDGVLYAPAGRSPQTVVVADFNGDGRQDLAVPDFYSTSTVGPLGDVSLFLGNGDGTFQPAAKISIGDQANWLAVGNFSNSKPGLAVPSQNTGHVEVLLGNGDATFQAPAAYPVSKGPDWIGSADFTGDGIPDLITANYSSSDVALLSGKGDGTFNAPVTFAIGATGVSGTVADLNGDGKMDLVIACGNSGNIVVLLGNGNGTFQAPASYAIGKFANSVTAADLDGDGKPDLAVIDSLPFVQAKGLAVLHGNGDGTFQAPVYFDAGPSPNQVASADLNKDGKIDLAVSNAVRDGTVDVTVLLNTTGSLANVSAASFAVGPVAPDTIVAAFGTHLATGIKTAVTTPLPTDLNGTTVRVKDAGGNVFSCQEYFVSAPQVNYLLPGNVAAGQAVVTIRSGDGAVTTGTMQVAPVAPGLFALNASGLAAALVLRLKPGASQTVEQVYQLDPSKNIVAAPIDLGPETDKVYLLLFGTGIRHVSSKANVSVVLGSVTLPVLFAGAQGTYFGEDQVNVGPVPRSLISAGSVSLVLTADNIKANTLNLTFK